MPKDTSIKSILIIGSGPIVIGQACEFDYSGTQASLSLKEEGIKTILINSNPATIMTDPMMADKVYLLPLEPGSIEKILAENEIDAVLPTMGGQTALNLAIECDEMGIWEKYNVKLVGVDIEGIKLAEDRDKFKQLMVKLGIGVAPSKVANSFLEGKEIAQNIGFPLVIRPSFTLAGTGGSFVHTKEEFDEKLKRGLEASPVHEVLIEKALFGWKEFELELLIDSNDNMVIICTVENFDPMGIHTGDSITVAPAMTLPDTVYQKMRNQSKQILKAIGNFAGGCNVQFALNPENEDIICIEINPRVSRSSALASKATGYPIAKIAAKLAIGYHLDELKNQITKTTSAFFEPSLDYVIVKIPRWNFEKFPGADETLGLQMKSVGEVMGIGRNFQEALQKACQSLENNKIGLGVDGNDSRNVDEVLAALKNASWDRIFKLREALKLGVPKIKIYEITKIDFWFLRQIQELVDFEQSLKKVSFQDLDKETLLKAKRKGFSDLQLAYIFKNEEDDIYNKRKEWGLKRVYKMVDTCAAEFDAQTPYFYSTFEAHNDSIVSDKKKVVVLGSGPNRIGQGIEFDYCCVHGLFALKEMGYEAIMVNCNPETVSTDFNTASKLYFEPVFWEHLREIIDLEKPEGVIVQLGGQTALKLAEKLEKYGIPIIGTSYDNMDLAEDRERFSDLLKALEIPYPRYGAAKNADDALDVAHKVGYPVLVRPSYVLGGQKMRIVINDDELTSGVVSILKHFPDNNILIDHFIDRAEEAEVDALCDGTDVHIMGIMEHIEPAGIHSGDSHSVLPPFSLSDEAIEKIKVYSKRIALALNVKGLINIQFVVKRATNLNEQDEVFVIEANPRASRTTPFICKAYQIPYLNYAAKIMTGDMKVKDIKVQEKLDGYAIKEPVFSFDKFPNVKKELGPEMRSTGESIRFVSNIRDPHFRNLFKMKSMYLSR
jgi:carbamoyl-phosphate synthase large subunit